MAATETKNRQVVLTRAGIVAAAGVVVALLAVFGVGVNPATTDKIVDVLVIVLPIVLPLGSALWARLHVTPVFDPRDAQGRKLVPTEDDMAADHGYEPYVGKHRA